MSTYQKDVDISNIFFAFIYVLLREIYHNLFLFFIFND